MCSLAHEVQINLDLLLPGIESADECVALLNGHLAKQKGIEQAHIVQENGQAKLCVHFDPNLASLAVVQRLAQEASADITSKYRHRCV